MLRKRRKGDVKAITVNPLLNKYIFLIVLHRSKLQQCTITASWISSLLLKPGNIAYSAITYPWGGLLIEGKMRK